MDSFISSITPPDYIPSDPHGGGLIVFLNFFMKVIFIAGGLFALWQFVMAGYIFIGSSGDAKALGTGRDKLIWSIVGLLIMVAAPAVAMLVGSIFYGDANAILNPKIVGGGS